MLSRILLPLIFLAGSISCGPPIQPLWVVPSTAEFPLKWLTGRTNFLSVEAEANKLNIPRSSDKNWIKFKKRFQENDELWAWGTEKNDNQEIHFGYCQIRNRQIKNIYYSGIIRLTPCANQ